MSLPSGQISLNDVRTLLGVSGSLDMNNARLRTLFRNTTSGATISMNQGQNKSKYIGTACGTTNENTTLTMSVPEAGTIFNRVDFASYGTPNGTCGAYTVGSCAAGTSTTIVQNTFIGQSSASLAVNNTTFGDPCAGTFKRIYVQLSYGV